MNLLFTGRGSAGSWEVRGAQLGEACGAKVIPQASVRDCEAADLIVVVKRVPPDLLRSLRQSQRKWVLDVVDFYPQPVCADWNREQSIGWVKQQIRALNPSAVIWPTGKMEADCSDGRPGFVLPHHHRPGIVPNPIRREIKTVGYEGNPRYLGGWEALIQRECRRRGWIFVTNPARLSELDIVIAVRGDRWVSYAAKHWKSNVKLANAHASGTPFVGNPEWGYMETASGCEYWADTGLHLAEAFDRLGSHSEREMISDRFRQKAYSVQQAAGDLCTYLTKL